MVILPADTVVRPANADDVAEMAALAQARRRQYEAAQPQFWRVADEAVERHTTHLAGVLDDSNAVALVARRGAKMDGFVLASVVPAPPVYDPGGPTGLVDDFAVVDDGLWPTTGRALLSAARDRLAGRGAAQIVVVCGHHDRAKLAALLASGLSRASEWLVAPVTAPTDDPRPR